MTDYRNIFNHDSGSAKSKFAFCNSLIIQDIKKYGVKDQPNDPAGRANKIIMHIKKI